jgi:hypothetical protein
MKNQQNKCFVCNDNIIENPVSYNIKVHLPVCKKCRGTKEEQLKEKEAVESLGEGFVSGCI